MAERDTTEVGAGEFVLPICTYCLHEREDGTCVAFPKGIPFRILGGLQDHAQVQQDQTGGTVFEQDPAAPPAPREQWNSE